MRNLSKSKLLAYRQCPKRLWLEVYRPDLQADTTDIAARFQVGHQVGEIVRRLYDPSGSGTLVDVHSEGFGPALARSAALLNSTGPLFEAGFAAEGALVFADIMLPWASSPSIPGALSKSSPQAASRTTTTTTLLFRRSSLWQRLCRWS